MDVCVCVWLIFFPCILVSHIIFWWLYYYFGLVQTQTVFTNNPRFKSSSMFSKANTQQHVKYDQSNIIGGFHWDFWLDLLCLRSYDLDRAVINPTICSGGLASEITWNCNFHCMVLMPKDYSAGYVCERHVNVEESLTNKKRLKDWSCD